MVLSEARELCEPPKQTASRKGLPKSYRIHCVCALHEQSAPAAKQQKIIEKYNYFWLKQSFEQVFFFSRGCKSLIRPERNGKY